MASILCSPVSPFVSHPLLLRSPSSLSIGIPCSHPVIRPVLATSSLRTSVAPPKLNELWKWLIDNAIVPESGALVRPEIAEEGVGLRAQRTISQGEEVFRVPQDFWISASAAKTSEVGKFCEGLRPWVAVAVFLLFEKSKPNSKWRPYIDILPESLDSPLFWSDEELNELEGTQLLGSILGYKEYVDSEYGKLKAEVLHANPGLFDESVFTPDAFLWAFGILRSRTFPPLTGEDLALVPLADLVNHGSSLNSEKSSWEKTSAGFFSRQEFLTMCAPGTVKTGEQVLMQYGKKKSNGLLALDYGFVEFNENNNVSRDCFMLTLEIPDSDRFFADKLDIVELNGLSTTVYFDLVRGQGPADNMLPFLRLLALSGPDAFLLEALFRDSVWEHLQSPVSRENEEAVCKAILDGCHSALAGYSTTIDEDLKLLNSGQLGSRFEMAVVVRLGEKRVLEELQLWFETQMASLDQLEYYAERRLRSLGLIDEKGEMTPWVFKD